MTAPVVVIVAYDLEFFDRLPQLFAHRPHARELFAGPGNVQLAHETAFRNGSLQGAFLIIAARLLGLDCGPMSGFSNTAVDREFFEGTRWRSNFLCGLGYGDAAKVFPRGPRLDFNGACRVL